MVVAAGLAATPAHAQLDALNDAALHGDLARIVALIAQGAAIDGDGSGYSPLMFAAGWGQTEAVRLLLRHGASPAYRDHNGDRALLWAAKRGHAGAVALLLASGDPADSDLDPYRRPPLFDASLYGRVDVVRLLLEAGADPNWRDQTNDTPLHAASTWGQAEVVALLLAAGAEVNPRDDIFQWAPIHRAARDKDTEALRRIVAAGGDVTLRDWKGRTPLWLAAEVGFANNVAFLVESGAAADTRDDAGITAFAAATSMNRNDERPDDFHATALALASHVTELDAAFADAAWVGFSDIATMLIGRGARASGLDSLGRPALAGAAMNAGGELFELMLANGAEVTSDGPAALLAAAELGRDDLVRRLLDLGVPVDTRDRQGGTALLVAAAQGRTEVVGTLLAAGADRTARDATGLDAEARMNREIRMLLDELEGLMSSRALQPTEHIDTRLAELRFEHQRIRLLLAG